MLFRRECVAWNHAYLSGEISVGDIAAHVGVCTPIMHLPMVFHGEVGGTKEVYRPSRGTESLSGSPSLVTIWRKPLCTQQGCRPVEEVGRSRVPPLAVGGGGRSGCVSCCESALAPTSSILWEASETQHRSECQASPRAMFLLLKMRQALGPHPRWCGCGQALAENGQTAQCRVW